MYVIIILLIITIILDEILIENQINENQDPLLLNR